ncbi:dihydrodipicolinate reductase C-terminal domain-containing protein [Actinophytocola algeriensis]|uniref:4-hydroxy-tetrahydrodipicolinate reductase n=1 Tax=Actinophytocola algeriensis TaxID=1768010 RepID=A0A7W7QBS4_9PSEU|nr:dihydrodipicolinate reductase C-terminal domain-containing protein [Actinophytocola algeriensis]MBB4910645.1 4-hydroxy-tetrahydrodipicolinate reductase [Actinophytocola algeriensis]MBE1473638.1 4-hydroxy-tetrahydrodipicolinate reductase [Actinophytocola algeriensis]
MSEARFTLGVVGSTGRLGTAIMAECRHRNVPVGVTASRAGWRLDEPANVLVDASSAGALADTVDHCQRHQAALVYAVSTISPAAHDRLWRLSELVPVLLADNLSFGHWLQTALVRTIATLTAPFENQPRMSVFERHPVTKADRPSASARSLAAAWAGASPPNCHGEVASFRAGQPVSDHVVTFDLPGESVSVHHGVSDLRAAAMGLLVAAAHLAGRSPGLLLMDEVYSAVAAEGARR